ncbi:MAG: cytochrome B [Deferribacteres bacterium]|nr:cytochrome B [Deferribacteres bacterium]
MKRIYLHPLPVRIWHWIHAACITLLVITGVFIRYSEHFGIPLRTAVKAHNIVGIIVALDFLLWFGYYVFTGKIKIYFPTKEELLKQAIRQIRYYSYGIFVGEPNPFHPTPENKFNPLQKTAYLSIMLFLLPLQIFTGFLLLYPDEFREVIEFFGGIRVIDTIHVLLFFFFASFIIAHFYLATLGHTPLAHFKAMITGWEEEPEEHH